MADDSKNEAAAVTGTGSTLSVSPTPTPSAPAPKPSTAPTPAPVTEKPNGAASVQKGVEAKDEHGNALGFTLDVGGEPGQGEGNAALASRVRGWTPFKVDGEDFPYTAENALLLLNRFPYIAKQLEQYQG